MKYIEFGNTGLRVSRLGIGAINIGPTAKDKRHVVALMNRLLDAGVNLIDTAQCYPRSEELIGKYFAHRRRDYILVTKCGHHKILSDGSIRSLSISMKDIDQALIRLRTDYLDAMLLHSYDYALLEKGDAIEVLVAARQAGKIRFIGYSGDNECALWAAQCREIDIIEMSVNICDQHNIRIALPECLKRNVAVIAKKPIANAAWLYINLQEKASNHFRAHIRHFIHKVFPKCFKHAFAFTTKIPIVYATLRYLIQSEKTGSHFAEYVERLKLMNLNPQNFGCMSMAELALCYTISQTGVHCAIVQSSRFEHQQENILTIEKGSLKNEYIHDICTVFDTARNDEQWLSLN